MVMKEKIMVSTTTKRRCRQVASRTASVGRLRGAFFNANLVARRVTFLRRGNVSDWLLLFRFFRGFALWSGCDARSPCADNDFFILCFPFLALIFGRHVE